MNDLRKRLGIDDWLEIIKEDRVCNGAYISIAQYMYLLEQENKKYKEVIDRAVQLAYQYAQIDGGHHKMWVIDQMMRILLGSKYDNFVKEYEEDGEYEWNIGIAP